MRNLILGLTLLAGCGCAPNRTDAPLPAPTRNQASVRVVAGDGQTVSLGFGVLIVAQTAPGETLLVAYPFRGTGNFFVTADQQGFVQFLLPAIVRGPQTVQLVPWSPFLGPETDVTVTGR